MMECVDPPPEFDRPDAGLHIVKFGPPPGFSSGEIGFGRFLVDRTDLRMPYIFTYWAPSEAELRLLDAGAVLQFGLVTQVPPPVSAAVYMPVPTDEIPVAPVDGAADG